MEEQLCVIGIASRLKGKVVSTSNTRFKPHCVITLCLNDDDFGVLCLIALDKTHFSTNKYLYFSYFLTETYVMDTH